jgi:alpha-galactosidase
VLSVNQHSTENKVIYKEGDIRVWTAKANSGDAQYLAVFNLADSQSAVHLTWDQVGIASAPNATLELCTGKNETRPAALNVTLAPHASGFYKLSSR